MKNNLLKICYLTIDNTSQPVSLLRIVPYTHIFGVEVKLGCKILRFIKKDNLITDFELEVDNNVLENCDIVFIQRSFIQESTTNIIEKIIKLKKKIIYDTDDLLIDLPIKNESSLSLIHNKSLYFLNIYNSFFDVFTTSNDLLTKELSKIFKNKSIKTIPNLILDDLFPKKIKKKNNNYFKILISGTQKEDQINFLLPTLKKLIASYKNFLLIFMGLNNKIDIFKDEERVIYISLTNYKDYLFNLQKISPDLALAPLKKNVFNQYKSNIKFLDYSYFNIPGVYSDISCFADSIQNYITGILCNENQDWGSVITDIYENKTKRLNIAKAANNEVLNKYLISKNLIYFKNILDEFK